MQIQRVNRTDAEKIFIVVHNVAGATATTGYGLRFVGGTEAQVASADGAGVVLAVDADFMYSYAGIAAQDIPDNGYGRSQIWGYVNSIAYSAEANKTIGAASYLASVLKHGATGYGFTSAGLATAQAMSTFGYRYVVAWNTTNISGGVPYGSGFIRGL